MAQNNKGGEENFLDFSSISQYLFVPLQKLSNN